MTPLVSIIIPMYNAEGYIEETIQSALDQTWPNIEIILVDDGSTDRSYQVAKSYGYNNIRIFRQENKGASAARNYGLREAKGDYIQFLDADDLLSPNKIEKQIALIEHNHATISFCENVNFKDDVSLGKLIPISFKDKTDPFEVLVEMYGGFGNPSMTAVHSWLTPSKVIRDAGFWNEELSTDDDGEYFCRVVLAAQKIIFCKGVRTYYRKFQENSLSSQKSLKHYRSELLSIQLKCSYMLNRSNSYPVRQAMAFWFMRLAILCYPKYKEITEQAMMNVTELDVEPDIPVMGGRIVEIIKKNLGWKAVRIIQSIR